MGDTNPDPGERIDGDSASFQAVVLAMASWLITLILVLATVLPDVPGAQRSNPVYWLIMLPFAAWGVSLITLQPFAVRMMVPTIILLPLMALLAVVLGGGGAGSWIAAAASAAFAIASAVVRSGSALSD